MKKKQVFFEKIILFVVLSLISQHSLAQNSTEKLNYNIYYQWGILWKMAGTATLTSYETMYHAKKAKCHQMAAKTTPFFDAFVKVRDTLVSYTTPNIEPIYYAKLTHESKYHAKEDVTYNYQSSKTVNRIRLFKDSKMITDSTISFSKTGMVYDMLSVFYLLRNMDSSKLKSNNTFPLVIVSGDKYYNIKVIPEGEMKIKTPNDKTYTTVKVSIVFEYLQKNRIQKEVMEYWMSNDDRKVPIMFSVKLPLGSMKAYFEGVDD